ncbi:MAG TPA: HD domain-containing phosphohydrolase [Vicinamibacteria bacterium]|jgi:putative nucleotidyltransferase with HDIG domain|nr:HD domain-containing phosphohydrolase [Vicinamibacteria bacterium]
MNSFTHSSEVLVSILDTHDLFYPGHSRPVAAHADRLTRRLGLSDEERRNVHFAALLHDIGKIRIEPALLSAEGNDSEEARRRLREHPGLGVELLRPIAVWEGVLPIIYSHHERWDGRGYPSGLRGEEIPLGGRVVAVADAFDAMTRKTPRGAHKTLRAAAREILSCAGTQFDRTIATLFVSECLEFERDGADR